MLGAQPAFLLGRLDGVGHLAHLAVLEAAVLVRAHAQAVEDGGDAGGDDLRVMRLDRRRLVPADAGTRRIMAFQMVGMQLDKAGDQVIAFEILADCRIAFGDIGDLAVADQDGALDDLVLKDDAGVGKDGLFGHIVDLSTFGAGKRQPGMNFKRRAALFFGEDRKAGNAKRPAGEGGKTLVPGSLSSVSTRSSGTWPVSVM